MLIYFTAIWYISRAFGIFYGHLVNFMAIWYIFHRFGKLYQEKSGNPAPTSPKNKLKIAVAQFLQLGACDCRRVLQVSRADRCACDAGDAGDAENVASV
jgi:hypothetical protein